ncbi:HalD/BesD family halogenase [Haloechinothrix halophila]|uniref:HalD/BesD family halogenase n=1 Tax=Haloechinothrix halophila TaxID=1069073 RepID=UPI0004282389|nr:ArpA protein [Haloechinothrix halophila]
MDASGTQVVEQLVNTERYPLSDPGSDRWRETVATIRDELRDDGCSVLAEFVRPELRDVLRSEGAEMAPSAYYDAETVNAYNVDTDADLPDDHPGRTPMQRGNAFVPRDAIPSDTIIHRLYLSTLFQRFLADCFELTEIHPLADPLAGLVLNVVSPGKEHPWHFDTNEFTVTMLTQESQAGGTFEYCPNIRSAESENFDDVNAVLAGDGEHLIRTLELRPGDLQLFKGRYALHRVSAVQGERARHTAIFAYSERDGVIGTPARTKQLFGRVLPEHHAAAAHAVRVDQLLD